MPGTAWLLRSEDRLRVTASLILLAVACVIALLTAAFLISFAWPDSAVASPRHHLVVGSKYQFAYDKPTYFAQGDFWLVRRYGAAFRDPDRFFAFYDQDSRRDVNLPCTVPWLTDSRFSDPTTGIEKRGWFRSGCHGQTYDLNGHCVFGPCFRDLDQYPVRVEGGRVIVNINHGRLIKAWGPRR